MKRTNGWVALGIGLMLVLPWSIRAATYKVAPVANGAVISGVVSLAGKAPKPDSILITKNTDVCGDGYRQVQWVQTGAKGGLQEMVVYLDKVKQGKNWPAEPFTRKAQMDQKGCLFTPWFQVVRKKDSMTIKNSDPVLHNIHIRELIGIKVGKARGVKRTMLNEAQPSAPGDPAQDLNTKISPRRSNFIAINCEAHNFMFAWMFAADHPYVAVTGTDGQYSLADVPPGKYKLTAWHPSLGMQQKKITVKAGGKITGNFTYKTK